MPERALILAAMLCTFVACDGDDGTSSVIVDVRTDLSPGVDFAAVDVSLRHSAGTASDSTPALGTEDWFNGIRVAEFSGAAPGLATLQVAMRDSTGAIVLRRPVEVTVRGDLGITVAMTRDCLGVSCPGAADAASATACLGGSCVEAECRVGVLQLCGSVRCIADIGCGMPAGCVTPRCVGGACVFELDQSMCASGEICDAIQSCVGELPPNDAGTRDVGTPDAGCEPDCPDTGAPCPLAPISPFVGTACDASSRACLEMCVDSGCQNACLAADPNADCLVCINQNLSGCYADAGCQPEWDCWAQCAGDMCADIYSCTPDACNGAWLAFNFCTQRTDTSACLTSFDACFE